MDYLVHHGILGMRWGVRRYQNKDGTLTEEGKLRVSQKFKELELKDLSQEEREKAYKQFDKLPGVKKIRSNMKEIRIERKKLKDMENKYWNSSEEKREPYLEKLFQEELDPTRKWESQEERDAWKEYYMMEDDYTSYPNSFSYWLNDHYNGGYKKYESDREELANREIEESQKYAKEYLGEFSNENIDLYPMYTWTIGEDFANTIIRMNRPGHRA